MEESLGPSDKTHRTSFAIIETDQSFRRDFNLVIELRFDFLKTLPDDFPGTKAKMG